jgi:hypothetical protein
MIIMQLRRRKWSRSRSACATLSLILLLLVANPFVSAVQGSTNTANSSEYTDHGFAALAAGDKVTLESLTAMTGGNLSVAAFESIIQDVFLPLNVREVLLDIGWQNFTAGSPPHQAWVDNWFTASDVMGINNVLYVGQLTKQGFGSPWVNGLINEDPSVATDYPNGTRAAFVSLDNPEVTRYIESDLAILYSYYGKYPSWVGLGTGSSQSNPYYEAGGAMPIVGYSNLSISSFVNSPYYDADVNGTGYLPDGELDALWSSFRNVQPAIVLSSGLWMTSSPVQLYGSGANASYVEMRFQIPTDTTNLQVGWYGQKVGSPGGLNALLYGDSSGSLNRNEDLGNVTVPAGAFTSSVEWQNGINLQGNFSAGDYWIVLSSHSSNATNNYIIYIKDYLINNATAKAAEPYYGPGFIGGSTILWLKNATGQSIAIYPYQEAEVGAPTQVITATHAYFFNTVFLFLSDRPYNPANATLMISDVTEGNRVVATGSLSQTLVQGLENWVPITLNGTVTTVPGHKYLLTVNDPSDTWYPIMRMLTTDPPQAGFQNQSQTLLFQLANLAWGQGSRNWGGMTSTGNDAVTTGYMDAVRFSPSINETVKSVQILMDTSQGTIRNYTSGTVSVAIWESYPNGSAPEGPPLQQLNVPATRVPQNGFLNVSGFGTAVTAGKDYWIVFSANSTERFTFGRLTSPFEFLVLVSRDLGASWSDPSEGPTEYAFTVALSKETLGTFVAGELQTALTSNSIFAQSFFASSDTSVEGIYIGPLRGGPDLLISIDPTGADGNPAVSPLGWGVYHAGNITLDYGPEFVQFSSVANLQKGDEYWITIHPIGGNYQVDSLVYLKSAPNVPAYSSAVISNDNGLAWKRISNTTNTIPEYLLETAPTRPPQYDTQSLVDDLSTNHDFPVASGPLKGWNAYVQAAELSTFNGIAQWVSNLTGRNFEFYANAQVNVANQLNLKNIVVLPTTNSTLTCEGFLSEEEVEIASAGSQFTYGPLSLLQQCSSKGIASLAQQLNYLPYTGKNFGLSTSGNILVVGDQSAQNLTNYLSNAFNVTYAGFSLDPILQTHGDLSSFKVILWVSSSNKTISSTVSNLLSQYVRNGGEFVTTDASLADLNAFTPKKGEGISVASALNFSSFLRTAVAHTGYANDSFQQAGINTTVTAKSSDLVISSQALGLGKVVFIGFGSALIPQIGDQLVVISNILSNSMGVQPPFWYELADSKTPLTGMYSIEGTRGSPLLLRMHNPSNSTSLFTLSLNGSYYGIPSSWKTVEIPGLSVTLGSGSSVRIQTTVPAETLIGVLIVPMSEPLIDYSTALVQRQFAYPDQSLYYIQGTENQTVLVMISTNMSANQILLNDGTSLPQASSVGQLQSAKSGWFFDGQTESLFVKYQSSGVDSLRYVFYTPPASPPATLPQRTLVTMLGALVAVEVVTLAFLAFRGRRERSRRQNAGNSYKA